MIDRQTRDLDLFATTAAHVSGLVPVIERRLVEDGLSVSVERFSKGFARLTVADGSASTVVDLAWEQRVLSPSSHGGCHRTAVPAGRRHR